MVWILHHYTAMKYVAPSLLLGLLLVTSGNASASPAAKAPRATVEAVFNDVGQALLFDRIQGEYVVVKVGDPLQGFRVTSIESDQIVLTDGTDHPRHYVLPLSATKPADKTATTPATRAATKPRVVLLKPAADAPLDPYTSGPAVPLDPYGKARPVKTVLAPPGSRATSTSPATPPGKTARKVTPPARITTLPPTIVQSERKPQAREETRTLSRAEFDKVMGDFYSLSKEVQIEAKGGTIKILQVSRGSFLHRMGLRAGDTVLEVAGKRIRGLDEAAAVYAAVLGAKTFNLKVKRRNQLITIRYRFGA